MSQYPEHDKLEALGEKGMGIVDLVEHLQSERLSICEWKHEYREGQISDGTYQYSPSGWYPGAHKTALQWVCEVYGIDHKALMAEKDQMLEAIRQHQASIQ